MIKLKNKVVLVAYVIACVALLCACNNNGNIKNEYAGKTGENEQKEYAESTDEETDTDRQIETPYGYPSMPYGNKEEKGYDLPIDARQREEAEEDCKEMMGLISELYKNPDKGCASNVVIADEVMDQMVEKLKATGCPVTITELYSNMENHKKLEDFLNDCLAGNSGSAIVYEIHSDGGIGRYKYSYDGKDGSAMSYVCRNTRKLLK